MVPNNPANPVTLQQALDADEQLRAMREDETVDRLMSIGQPFSTPTACGS
jgi:DNA polymerase-3 subunit alpha